MTYNSQLLTILFLIIGFLPVTAKADFWKYLDQELIPTVTGNRQIEIKPYISIKSGSTAVKFSSDAAMIKVGGVTVQTTKLKQRLLQAGCVYMTGGDVYTCAPDIIDREAQKLFNQISQGIDVDVPGTPTPNTAQQDSLKFVENGMTEIKWGEPKGPAVGYDFSNPGTAPAPQSPSAFIHSLAIERTFDDNNNVTISIVGITDFAFMNGKKGGVLCLFANEKGKFLHDSNGQYKDGYGVVAIGSSAKVTQSPMRIGIQLKMPWEELHLSNDDNPYEPKFVQCMVTVENAPLQATEWIPF